MFVVRWLMCGVVLLLAGCISKDGVLAQHPPSQPAATAEGGADASNEIAPGRGGDVPLKSAQRPQKLGTRRRGHDWPSFLGPTGDSKSQETGLIVPWPAAGPRVVWTKQVGTGYGIGSVAAGRYYHFDRHDVRRGVGSARLTCFNAETGDELWRFEYPCTYEDMLGYNNGPRASPVVDDDRVYIFGVEGMLHCLHAETGELIWKLDTAAKFNVVQNFFGVGSTPVIHGDVLICMVGGSPPGTRGLYESYGGVEGNGSGIVAFDKHTGRILYQITDELASYASPRIASIDGRTYCFLFCRGGLVAFEPSSGKVDFHYPWRASLLESVNASTPVIVGREVFISETYQIGSSLLSVTPTGYEVKWRDERRSRNRSFLAHWNTPIYVDGYLYGCSGRNAPDAETRCIRWETGEVAWSVPSHSRSSMLYVDGYLLELFEHGILRLVKPNPAKYEVISEVDLRQDKLGPLVPGELRPLPGNPFWAAPILAHGLLYIVGDEQLYCLEVIPDQAYVASTELGSCVRMP